MATDSSTYEYVVVGGGAAGCVLAARLSENPANRVLLLEAGGPNRNLFLKIPALGFMVATAAEYNWHFETDPVPELNDRRIKIHYGKIIGGSSSINGMQYARGNPAEYDAWGVSGWNFEEVLPYFRRSESNARGASRWHGASGPINVRRAAPHLAICDAFLAAAAEAGYPILDDINRDDVEGFGLSDCNIDHGKRISTAIGYLAPARKRPNLTVLTRAEALRVTIDGGVARGVEFLYQGTRKSVRCEREVVVCAGAIKSPHLLMLSGVGPPDELRGHGIPVVAESPRVGLNFQNHVSYRGQYQCRGAVSLYQYLHPVRAVQEGIKYLLFRSGALAEGFVAAFGAFKTDPSLAIADAHVSFIPSLVTIPSKKDAKPWEVLPKAEGFSYSLHLTPFSRGAVRLRTSDPLDHPQIVAGYFSDPRDMTTCMRALEKMREIAGMSPMRKLILKEIEPGDAVKTPAELEAAIRRGCGNSYHPVGTCAVGDDPSSVVDPELRVRGVKNLRVADNSIIPVIPNGGLHAPAIMIGEKAAAMIVAG